MFSVFSHLTRVYRINLKTPITKFRYIHHDSPGFLDDEKVALLKNSKNGSQIYLVGTIHSSIECANTIKKVINHVRPDAVALELCVRRAWDTWQGVVNQSVPMMDFEVAMEECSRIGARCFCIDQDIDVFHKGEDKLIYSDESLRKSYDKAVRETNKLLERRENTRAFWREFFRVAKEACPEYYKLCIEDRDKHMFTKLRKMEGKLVVAVVGLAHMDGIELLWKCAEDDDDDVRPLCATSDDVYQQKQ